MNGFNNYCFSVVGAYVENPDPKLFLKNKLFLKTTHKRHMKEHDILRTKDGVGILLKRLYCRKMMRMKQLQAAGVDYSYEVSNVTSIYSQ